MSTCLDCGRTTVNRYLELPAAVTASGRGLCRRCYSRHERRGTLVDFPRTTRSRDELLDDWVLLREQGLDRRAAAARMGMTYSAFDRALVRARSKGDPRAFGPGELVSA